MSGHHEKEGGENSVSKRSLEAAGSGNRLPINRKRVLVAAVVVLLVIAIPLVWMIAVRATSDTETGLSVSESATVSGPRGGSVVLFTSVVGDSPDDAARKLDLKSRGYADPILVPNTSETDLSGSLIVTAVCVEEAGVKRAVFQVANPSEIPPSELVELKTFTPTARTNDIAARTGCRSQVVGLVALK